MGSNGFSKKDLSHQRDKTLQMIEQFVNKLDPMSELVNEGSYKVYRGKFADLRFSFVLVQK